MYHVAIVTSYPFPSFAATSNRIMAMAKTLSMKKNVMVSVVGPSSDSVSEKEKISNSTFNIYTLKTKRYKGKNLIIRGFSELKDFINLKSIVLNNSPDLIIITIPSIFLLGISFFVKGKVPIIFDIRDLVWEYFLKKESYLFKLIGKLFKVVSISILKKHRKSSSQIIKNMNY